jgi:prepilin-type N-terminal cleavage/methylation domain-containing protein
MTRELKNKLNNKGFTLIETLVAIAVLMIAVAGPLSIAHKALTGALYAKNQSIASFLAQDEMELIKNIRDNYLVDNNTYPWWSNVIAGTNCNGDNEDTSYNNICGLDIVGSNISEGSCNLRGNCLLWFSFNRGYVYEDSADSELEETIFTRYFFIERNGVADPVATVVVKWDQGLVPSEIRLQSVLVDDKI